MYSITSKEKELLVLLNEGNEAAFEELYRLFSERLLAYLIRLVKIEAVATEILQETFIKIWAKRKSIDPERSFRSYLFRIAENKVYDFFRKAARDKKMQIRLINSASSTYSHIEVKILIHEDVRLLNDAIELLPPRRKQIFQLIKIEERSYEEVSRLLDISISTISDHIVKANKFIFDQLKHCHAPAIFIILFFL